MNVAYFSRIPNLFNLTMTAHIQVIKVSEIIFHPEWSDNDMDLEIGDLALLHLDLEGEVCKLIFSLFLLISFENFSQVGLVSNLFFLLQELDLNVYTPICLPKPSVDDVAESYNGRLATVTGWGDRDEDQHGNGDYPEILHELQDSVPITTRASCTISHGPKQFCITETQQDKRFCSGDSGGPVTLKVRKSSL